MRGEEGLRIEISIRTTSPLDLAVVELTFFFSIRTSFDSLGLSRLLDPPPSLAACKKRKRLNGMEWEWNMIGYTEMVRQQEIRDSLVDVVDVVTVSADQLSFHDLCLIPSPPLSSHARGAQWQFVRVISYLQQKLV